MHLCLFIKVDKKSRFRKVASAQTVKRSVLSNILATVENEHLSLIKLCVYRSAMIRAAMPRHAC